MLTFRDATVADAPALYEAERATAGITGHLVSEPDELSLASFVDRINELSDGRGKYLVAEKSGILVGHASLCPMLLRNTAHVVKLDICVHPGHTSQGHGRAILSALVEWARGRPGPLKIELLVRSVNEHAIALYRSAGFAEEGRLRKRVRLADGSFCDDLCMALFVDHRS
ncbi:putative acetyltransferase [Polaromonas sp. YR568]|uniref:GNAT family N-acetyltransferase n=1 Tax=Polaromonas sp. YR568 TaxID=1855301 RepID=UPI0008ECB66F|nr:N-acetyltransferase [Polaromonas sp. YR568]SFV02420.1 putative acetyltransferase [Polaromonas sp. YR568]